MDVKKRKKGYILPSIAISPPSVFGFRKERGRKWFPGTEGMKSRAHKILLLSKKTSSFSST
jgi:hypothetical protein